MRFVQTQLTDTPEYELCRMCVNARVPCMFAYMCSRYTSSSIRDFVRRFTAVDVYKFELVQRLSAHLFYLIDVHVETFKMAVVEQDDNMKHP